MTVIQLKFLTVFVKRSIHILQINILFILCNNNLVKQHASNEIKSILFIQKQRLQTHQICTFPTRDYSEGFFSRLTSKLLGYFLSLPLFFRSSFHCGFEYLQPSDVFASQSFDWGQRIFTLRRSSYAPRWLFIFSFEQLMDVEFGAFFTN